MDGRKIGGSVVRGYAGLFHVCPGSTLLARICQQIISAIVAKKTAIRKVWKK